MLACDPHGIDRRSVRDMEADRRRRKPGLSDAESQTIGVVGLSVPEAVSSPRSQKVRFGSGSIFGCALRM